MSTSVLPTIQSRINSYGYPIALILGNLGNFLIVILFSRHRQNTCSIYLICSTVANDLYLTFNSLVQIYPFSYADENTRAYALCKIRFYVSNVLGQIAKTIIILTCIDRYLFTSQQATFRAFSTPKRAKCLILVTILSWPLLASHIAIMTTLSNGQCGTFGIYSLIYTSYTIVFVGFLPPMILSVIGYLTYCNMKQIYNRVQPGSTNHNQTNLVIRRRDRELLIIVISEVFVYAISTTFYPLILTEMTISRYVIANKSVQYSQIESLIFTISFMLLFVNNAAPFYIYTIVSKSFRHDIKQLFINSGRRLIGKPITQPATRRTDATLSRREYHV
ncbi:unnamed protein product [Adineta ricciae]|uniref:G-protein coupled receptors family 1 profile domain-containing protein n=1 Tax=Adineta ricciae TaxID=249248 RepID=A0A813PCC3_ADIRI|nr:unnamed protein product [Adineta ricciae]CAF1136673.1 unnamed protein product [Adineta ricciae]